MEDSALFIERELHTKLIATGVLCGRVGGTPRTDAPSGVQGLPAADEAIVLAHAHRRAWGRPWRLLRRVRGV
jgi:hypothetical protein